MKKIIVLIIAVILVGGGYLYYRTNYATQDYYTQITETGKEVVNKDQNGKTYIDYRYNQMAYNTKNEAKKLTFTGNKERPLRQGAYLKLAYNEKKGVISWEEVSKKDLPVKLK